ncbi:VasL domain-containing protein [Erwinia mallotivora]|uniref:Membrane protein n=1 Tax=Erwinia mallotivora TaxID=69222 RepID=A0A014PTP3_9GAMM|nr:VasL domain-containing protein [Erwinia mallotivora]EXU74192.1 membrane protein [Erwinia mallotivora]
MNDTPSRQLKTGGDPRTLADYAALREELSKLKHPARPDVNWHHAEKLCLSLFEQNGVELQTAAWYTLARSQLAGLFGLNEGLAILEALINHQRSALWPQSVHARMAILSSLSQRLQQRMRSLPLNDNDLNQLYRAEQLLTSLAAVLQRLELKHLSQLDTLRTLVHNNAVRLKNSDDTTSTGPDIQSGVALPASVINDAAAPTGDRADSPPDSAVKRVYVAQPPRQAHAEVLVALPAPVKKWKSFAAGICTMLMISAVAVSGWHLLNRPDPLQTQLAASLAPLPAPLTAEESDALRQRTRLPKDFIARTQQQLIRLEKLPAGWNIIYARKLAEQAQALWPDQAKPLIQQWQQQINASALSADAMNGWHEGMLRLQELTNQLNALDGQKGRYITVSELKTQVFAATRSFSKTVPVEEQLRQMNMQENPEMIPSAQKTLTEQHLKQLITSYLAVTSGQQACYPHSSSC